MDIHRCPPSISLLFHDPLEEYPFLGQSGEQCKTKKTGEGGHYRDYSGSNPPRGPTSHQDAHVYARLGHEWSDLGTAECWPNNERGSDRLPQGVANAVVWSLCDDLRQPAFLHESAAVKNENNLHDRLLGLHRSLINKNGQEESYQHDLLAHKNL